MANPYREAGDNMDMDVDISAGSQWWWKLPAALGMIGVLAGLFCWFAIGLRDCARPDPCEDSAEIISVSDSRRSCPNGARMWSSPVQEDKIEVHCVCVATIDAGAHP